jgi:hypothetical protein
MKPITPSLAKILIEKSPMHAKHALDFPDKKPPTRAMLLGKAVDALVFGPDTAHGETEPYGKIREEAQPIANAVMDYFDLDLPYQAKLQWTSDGGVPCSGRPDLLERTGPVDLKTASDCSDGGIIKAIEKLGYDIQMAAYCEAYSVLGRHQHPTATLVFVETAPPYDVRVVTLNELMLGEGTARWRKAVATWKECFATGKWPGRGKLTASPSLYRTKGYGSNGAARGFVDIDDQEQE